MTAGRGLRLCLLCALGLTVVVAAQTATASASSPRHSVRHGARRHHRARHTATLPRLLGAQCPYAQSPVSSQPLGTMRATLICLTNLERTSRGLPVVNVSSRLNVVAQRWTQTMLASGAFTHGSDFAGRITASGYDWQTAGENIATGFSTPLATVNAWMASTDHCRNILDPNFRDIGADASPGAVGSSTGPGTWTEDFGLLMTQSPLSHNSGPQNGCPYLSAG